MVLGMTSGAWMDSHRSYAMAIWILITPFIGHTNHQLQNQPVLDSPNFEFCLQLPGQGQTTMSRPVQVP